MTRLSRDLPRPGVAVVITTYNHAHFLAEAIRSVLAQTERPLEILVVDDGSTDDPDSVVNRFSDVRLIRQANQGLAAARNIGLAAVRADKVAFLDADDRLLPCAFAAGLDCFELAPDAGFVYGGHRVIDRSGHITGTDLYVPVGLEGYRDLLKGNTIGMHATVLYDRRKLSAVGGFDRTLRRCEDYDLYLRLSRIHSVASHPAIVAEYRRWHGANMSSNHREMLSWVLLVLGRQQAHARQRVDTAQDWRQGRRIWRHYYAGEIINDARREWQRRRSAARAIAATKAIKEAFGASPLFTVRWGTRMLRRRFRQIFGRPIRPPLGAVDLGDFNRVTPISSNFGFDRGTPIDRYYIERFLHRHTSDIQGRALEVGDDCTAAGSVSIELRARMCCMSRARRPPPRLSATWLSPVSSRRKRSIALW